MWKTGKRQAALSFKQTCLGCAQKCYWPIAYGVISAQTFLLVWTAYQPQCEFLLWDPDGFRADERLTL